MNYKRGLDMDCYKCAEKNNLARFATCKVGKAYFNPLAFLFGKPVWKKTEFYLCNFHLFTWKG